MKLFFETIKLFLLFVLKLLFKLLSVILPLAPLPRAQWQEVRIGIAGVDCRGCSFGAYNAVAELDGVLRATASFKDGLLIAWIDPKLTNREALEAALRKRNIDVTPAK